MKIDVQSFMLKKTICAFIAVFIISVSVKGQRHEIGVQIGLSNLVGDIGKTSYIFQSPVLSDISNYGIPFYGGVLYRMNFNPYQTVRLNVGFSQVQFIDEVAKEKYRSNRKLWGTNSVIEADLLFEYNFFPVNDEQKSLISPYIFGGIGGMLANTLQATLENDFRRDTLGNAITPTNDTDFITTPTYTSGKQFTMAIPFGIGLKYKFNYNWAFFGELMFRPTFSDSLDYSVIDESSVKILYNKDILSPGTTKSLLQDNMYKAEVDRRTQKFIEQRQVGNTNSKDWINSVTIGMSYSFGRPPCYCK